MHDLFLIQCKENYFNEIFPADPAIKQTKGYLILKDLAQSYFSENKYGEFEGLLWKASTLFNYGQRI
jgi:hypothetical protein